MDKGYGGSNQPATISQSMTALDFDDRGRAYVNETEFFDYLAKTARRDDYTKVMLIECQVGEKYWCKCECVVYFNSAGCKLALYNRYANYGEVF